MFERFTDRARRVVVLAQEEARLLDHDYIGTEHLLLGLIQEREGVAAKALEQLGISLDAVRAEVVATIGRGDAAPEGPHPLHARAKKVLELSLRAAPSTWGTTTSAPSTSCSASSARAGGGRPGACQAGRRL